MPEALKAQILRDVGRAQTYFRRLGADSNRAVTANAENLEQRSQDDEFIRRQTAQS